MPIRPKSRMRLSKCTKITHNQEITKNRPYFEAAPYKEMAKDVPTEHRDPYTRFEAPCPSWWCSKGYAIVYWDHRGSSQSPGYLESFHDHHFQDYSEMITWAADQPWSTGKVGMTGISYLGLNQVRHLLEKSFPDPRLHNLTIVSGLLLRVSLVGLLVWYHGKAWPITIVMPPVMEV